MPQQTGTPFGAGVRPSSNGGGAQGHKQAATAATTECVSTDVRDVLRSAMLHELTPVERLMVVLWYVERMSVAEIAMTLDMTELQVARTHGLVLAKLRRELDAV